MQKLSSSICTLLVTLLSFGSLYAQVTPSPYSSLGVGDLVSPALSNNFSKGDLGVAFPSYWHLNNMNPALLATNRYTVYEFGALLENKSYTVGDQVQTLQSGTLNYLAFGFPLKIDKLTVAVGLSPYSNVDFATTSRERVEPSGEDYFLQKWGEGGLNQVYSSVGVRVVDSLYLGVRAGYVFGTNTFNTSAWVADTATSVIASYKTATLERANLNSGSLGFGISYIIKTGDETSITLGLTHDLPINLNSTYLQRLERRTLQDIAIFSDTIVSGRESIVKVPARTAFGISFRNGYDWGAGLEITFQNWTGFQNSLATGGNLTNSYNIAFGGEFVPSANSEKFLNRVRYRAGLNFQKTPYNIANTQVNDFGINFGFSIPITTVTTGNNRVISLVNVGARVGQRGVVADQLVRENYFRLSIGATFSDRWFLKRKYE